MSVRQDHESQEQVEVPSQGILDVVNLNTMCPIYEHEIQNFSSGWHYESEWQGLCVPARQWRRRMVMRCKIISILDRNLILR